MSKLGVSFNLSSCNSESAEHSSDISSLLHRDDSELILFVDPNKESLFFVMENTSACWPVSIETTGLEESVSFLEEEVIGDQLSLLLFGHGG